MSIRNVFLFSDEKPESNAESKRAIRNTAKLYSVVIDSYFRYSSDFLSAMKS